MKGNVMRSIANYKPSKYDRREFRCIEDGVYETSDGYVTSMSFEQDYDMGEGNSAAHISQYPLEDVLDRFGVYVSDFYPTLNVATSETCYLEFKADNLNNIRALRTIIGKHVYDQVVIRNGNEYDELVIE